jgi:hypothetical protein
VEQMINLRKNCAQSDAAIDATCFRGSKRSLRMPK